MANEVQKPEYIDTPPNEAIAALDGTQIGSQPLLPPASQTNNQWQEVGDKISIFFNQLPEYLGGFFNQYRKPIINLGLIFAAIIAVRLLLAVLDAINDVPLLYSFFELVGIGYATWFVFRYLLKTSTRQELAEKISLIRKDILGREDS
ncbi:CAAD domain-containing protein [Iningainema tapete]|uniref:CAAD domain-containing protein n=1 Tax=Iningainema tapete BLCC-T55 TaxID=2748662 RepID=A0A8J6XCV9_9CYAN|nr:CAAD domain-containing protein [Iningainema tapete]MBD2772734.1 CAAD domain-containing protein [Iningainema tapete BLCC-T55]